MRRAVPQPSATAAPAPPTAALMTMAAVMTVAVTFVAGMPSLGAGAGRGVDVDRLAVAREPHLHCLADLAAQGREQVRVVGRRLTVDRDDRVADEDAGGGRGRAAGDAGDEEAALGLRVDAQVLGQVDLLDRDAEMSGR